MQSRAFTVTDTPIITITNDVGAVQVEAGVDHQVTAQALRQAHDFTRDLTQSDLDHITLTATQQGSHITIAGHTDLAHRTPIGSRSLTIDLLVTVPAQTDLTLTSAAGDVTLTGITGTVSAQITAGAIRATGLALAGTCALQTRTGNINLHTTLAPGTKLSLTTTTGNIALTLPQASATHLSGATRVGTIQVTGWRVPITTEQVTGASFKGDTASMPTSSAALNSEVGNMTVVAGS
jgi:hypothetical protein